MHRALTACAVVALALAVGAGPALAEPSGPTAPTAPSGKEPPGPSDKRCKIATALIPTATSVATSGTSNSAKQARVLRKLAEGKMPRSVKRALRAIADWFEAAPDRSVGERGLQLAALKSQVAIIVTWGGMICGEPIVTTTTSTSPSLVPTLSP